MHLRRKSHILILLLALFFLILVLSGISPKDRVLWILEVAPALVGIGILIFLYPRIKFSSALYIWCFIAACLMAIGAHYSYSEVPLFNYFKEVFQLERNNFDKLGHIVQGIIPVLITQEVLFRKGDSCSPGLIRFLAFCVALAVSAAYEMIEWLAIVLSVQESENFLGMQGYIWDAQSDMFFAMLGALSAVLVTRFYSRREQKPVS